MNKEIEKAAYKFAESQNDGNAFTAYYKGFISGAQFKENTDNVSLNKNTIPPMTNSLGNIGYNQTLAVLFWTMIMCL